MIVWGVTGNNRDACPGSPGMESTRLDPPSHHSKLNGRVCPRTLATYP